MQQLDKLDDAELSLPDTVTVTQDILGSSCENIPAIEAMAVENVEDATDINVTAETVKRYNFMVSTQCANGQKLLTAKQLCGITLDH